MPNAPLPFDPIAEARRQWEERALPLPAAMAAATSIMRVQQIVLGAVDRALDPFELTFARYEVLMLLSFSRDGRLPMGKIGVRLMVHPTSVTSSVGRLEGQGFVRRTAHADDRRIVLAAITSAGRQVLDAATEAVTASAFGLAALPGDSLDVLTAALSGLRAAAGDFAPG
jgi:DNA-binding MarR family transcriptional regulator